MRSIRTIHVPGRWCGKEHGLLTNTVLETYLKDEGLTNTNTQVDYQYPDLVDTNNGNAYVTTDSDLDIYWKLPADADVSGDFYVVHFNGLDRNYDVTDLAELIGDANHSVTIYSEKNNNLEVVTIGGEQYLKSATRTFSPFALVYDTQDEPVVEKVTVTFDSGKHGDFGWPHVTSKSVELTKGDKLADSSPRLGAAFILLCTVSVDMVSAYRYARKNRSCSEISLHNKQTPQLCGLQCFLCL